MTPEKLYRLIHSLKPEEKVRFSKALNLKGRKKIPIYLILYQRILSIQEWSKASEKVIRGKEFINPVIYHQNRDLLVARILKILTDIEDDLPSKAHLSKAIEFGALRQAKNALETGIVAATEREDFWSVLNLIQYTEELLESHQIHLLKENNTLDIPEITRACKLDLRLSEYHSKIKTIVLEDQASWRFRALQLLRQVDALSSHFDTLELKIQRIKTRLLFLSGDIQRAYQNQLNLVEKINNSRVNKGLVLQDYSLMIQLAADQGLESEAAFWTLKLGQLHLSKRIDQELRNKLWIRNSVILADQYWRFDLCKYAIEKLIESPSLFTIRKASTLLYTSALVALGTQHFEKGKEWLGKVFSIPKKERPHLIWQPYLIRMVLTLESGDDLDSSYRSAKRQFDRLPHQFPSEVQRLIKRIYNNPFSISESDVIEWEEKLQKLTQDPEEFNCSLFFDSHLWLRSKISGKSMAELDKLDKVNQIHQTQNSIGFF